MPSDTKKGGRRTSICNYRVKAGNKEVYSHPQKFQCATWMRENKDKYKEKLRLIPSNKMKK